MPQPTSSSKKQSSQVKGNNVITKYTVRTEPERRFKMKHRKEYHIVGDVIVLDSDEESANDSAGPDTPRSSSHQLSGPQPPPLKRPTPRGKPLPSLIYHVPQAKKKPPLKAAVIKRRQETAIVISDSDDDNLQENKNSSKIGNLKAKTKKTPTLLTNLPHKGRSSKGGPSPLTAEVLRRAAIASPVISVSSETVSQLCHLPEGQGVTPYVRANALWTTPPIQVPQELSQPNAGPSQPSATECLLGEEAVTSKPESMASGPQSVVPEQDSVASRGGAAASDPQPMASKPKSMAPMPPSVASKPKLLASPLAVPPQPATPNLLSLASKLQSVAWKSQSMPLPSLSFGPKPKSRASKSTKPLAKASAPRSGESVSRPVASIVSSMASKTQSLVKVLPKTPEPFVNLRQNKRKGEKNTPRANRTPSVENTPKTHLRPKTPVTPKPTPTKTPDRGFTVNKSNISSAAIKDAYLKMIKKTATRDKRVYPPIRNPLLAPLKDKLGIEYSLPSPGYRRPHYSPAASARKILKRSKLFFESKEGGKEKALSAVMKIDEYLAGRESSLRPKELELIDKNQNIVSHPSAPSEKRLSAEIDESVPVKVSSGQEFLQPRDKNRQDVEGSIVSDGGGEGCYELHTASDGDNLDRNTERGHRAERLLMQNAADEIQRQISRRKRSKMAEKSDVSNEPASTKSLSTCQEVKMHKHDTHTEAAHRTSPGEACRRTNSTPTMKEISDFIDELNGHGTKEQKTVDHSSKKSPLKHQTQNEQMTKKAPLDEDFPVLKRVQSNDCHSSSLTSDATLNSREYPRSVGDSPTLHRGQRNLRSNFAFSESSDSSDFDGVQRLPMSSQNSAEIKVTHGQRQMSKSSSQGSDPIHTLDDIENRRLTLQSNKLKKTPLSKHRIKRKRGSMSPDLSPTLKRARSIYQIEKDDKKMKSFIDKLLDEPRSTSEREQVKHKDHTHSRRALFTSVTSSPNRTRSMLREGPDHPLTKMLSAKSREMKIQSETRAYDLASDRTMDSRTKTGLGHSTQKSSGSPPSTKGSHHVEDRTVESIEHEPSAEEGRGEASLSFNKDGISDQSFSVGRGNLRSKQGGAEMTKVGPEVPTTTGSTLVSKKLPQRKTGLDIENNFEPVDPDATTEHGRKSTHTPPEPLSITSEMSKAVEDSGEKSEMSDSDAVGRRTRSALRQNSSSVFRRKKQKISEPSRSAEKVPAERSLSPSGTSAPDSPSTPGVPSSTANISSQCSSISATDPGVTSEPAGTSDTWVPSDPCVTIDPNLHGTPGRDQTAPAPPRHPATNPIKFDSKVAGTPRRLETQQHSGSTQGSIEVIDLTNSDDDESEGDETEIHPDVVDQSHDACGKMLECAVGSALQSPEKVGESVERENKSTKSSEAEEADPETEQGDKSKFTHVPRKQTGKDVVTTDVPEQNRRRLLRSNYIPSGKQSQSDPREKNFAEIEQEHMQVTEKAILLGDGTTSKKIETPKKTLLNVSEKRRHRLLRSDRVSSRNKSSGESTEKKIMEIRRVQGIEEVLASTRETAPEKIVETPGKKKNVADNATSGDKVADKLAPPTPTEMPDGSHNIPDREKDVCTTDDVAKADNNEFVSHEDIFKQVSVALEGALSKVGNDLENTVCDLDVEPQDLDTVTDPEKIGHNLAKEAHDLAKAAFDLEVDDVELESVGRDLVKKAPGIESTIGVGGEGNLEIKVSYPRSTVCSTDENSHDEFQKVTEASPGNVATSEPNTRSTDSMMQLPSISSAQKDTIKTSDRKLRSQTAKGPNIADSRGSAINAGMKMSLQDALTAATAPVDVSSESTAQLQDLNSPVTIESTQQGSKSTKNAGTTVHSKSDENDVPDIVNEGLLPANQSCSIESDGPQDTMQGSKLANSGVKDDVKKSKPAENEPDSALTQGSKLQEEQELQRSKLAENSASAVPQASKLTDSKTQQPNVSDMDDGQSVTPGRSKKAPKGRGSPPHVSDLPNLDFDDSSAAMFDVDQFFDDGEVSTVTRDEDSLSHTDFDFPEFPCEDMVPDLRLQEHLGPELTREDGLPELSDSTSPDRSDAEDERSSAEEPQSKRRKKSDLVLMPKTRSQSLERSELMMSQLLSHTYNVPSQELSPDAVCGSDLLKEMQIFGAREPPLTPRNPRKRHHSSESMSSLDSLPLSTLVPSKAFLVSHKKHGASISRLVRQKKKDHEVDKMEEILLSDLKKGGFRRTLENSDGNNDRTETSDCDSDTKRAINLMKKDWGTLPELLAHTKVFEAGRLKYCHHSMTLRSNFTDGSLEALPIGIKALVSRCTARNLMHCKRLLPSLLNTPETRVQTYQWLLKILQYHPDCDAVERIIQSSLRENRFNQSPLTFCNFKSSMLGSGAKPTSFSNQDSLRIIKEDPSELDICEKCARRRRKPRNLMSIVQVLGTTVHLYPLTLQHQQQIDLAAFLLLLLKDKKFIPWSGEILSAANIILQSMKNWAAMKILLTRRIMAACPRLQNIQEIAFELRYRSLHADELCRIISFAVLKLHVYGEDAESMILDDFNDTEALVDIVDHLRPGQLELYLVPDELDDQGIGNQKRSFYHLSLLLPLLNMCIGDKCKDNDIFVAFEKISSILRSTNKRIRDNGAIYRSQVKYELSLFIKNLRILIQKAPRINQASIFKYLRSAPVHEEVVGNQTEEESSDESSAENVCYNDGDDDVKVQMFPSLSGKSSTFDDGLAIAEVIKSKILKSGKKGL